MCDESKDNCDVEQASISIRFVNLHTSKIEERFIGFSPLEIPNAESISNAILEKLSKSGLSIKNCRAQTYDGASVMSGCHNGVQSKIKQLQKKAIYIHCFSHVLNLCVMAGVDNVYI